MKKDVPTKEELRQAYFQLSSMVYDSDLRLYPLEKKAIKTALKAIEYINWYENGSIFKYEEGGRE